MKISLASSELHMFVGLQLDYIALRMLIKIDGGQRYVTTTLKGQDRTPKSLRVLY